MKLTVREITRAAVVAAVYVVICFILRPISFGPVQLRISEALTILPVFMPEAIWGVFVGCLISNLLGGSSIALLDVILGSLTTLCAAILTRRIYVKTNNIFLSLIPPVILNAIIVGSYVPFLYSNSADVITLPVILLSMLTVGIGEAIAVYVFGSILFAALKKVPQTLCRGNR